MCITLGQFKSKNKQMKNNIALIIGALAILSGLSVVNAATDFGTLITTASERKIIDDNRYVIKKITTVATLKVEPQKVTEYKTIEKEFKISGISIANNGLDSAWINGKLYENGEMLDSKTKLTIYGEKRKVRLTVRNGKTYYGQSGDTVTVSYKVALTE